MNVASASSSSGTTETPAVPDPPKYTACIAHLAATAAKSAKGQAAPSTAKLKSECEAQYKALQAEALSFLISSQWVLSEAVSLGVKLSDDEVKKAFAGIKTDEFPKVGEAEKYLATSGQTVSDLLLRVKLNLLSQKIEAKVIKPVSQVTQAEIAKYYNENKKLYTTPGKRGKPGVKESLTEVQAAIKEQLIAKAQQAALTKFTKEFKAKWKAKTECRSGYAVADCKDYKAP
jgi:foldase protein PrsA